MLMKIVCVCVCVINGQGSILPSQLPSLLKYFVTRESGSFLCQGLQADAA